jgi:hypothetical protein
MQLYRVALLLTMPALVAAFQRQIQKRRDPSARSLLNGRALPASKGEFADRKSCQPDPKTRGKVQCFPDLMFVGESKAGTSSVMSVFMQHPRILAQRIQLPMDTSTLLGGKDGLLEAHVFDKVGPEPDRVYDKLTRPYQTEEDAMNTLLMHYTPNYIYFPDSPFLIRKLYPNAQDIRYFIMVRDPAKRAVSGWRYHASDVFGASQDTRSFSQVVGDGIRQRRNLEACYAQELLQIGPGAPPFVQESHLWTLRRIWDPALHTVAQCAAN